jgi:NAD(P)-dependent dehydrogenase (short-subunit alcohol dehydrogenase family)
MAIPRTFIITGGTSGMGLELVRQLGRDPANVVIVGARSPATAQELRAAIPETQLTLITLDLEKLSSVRSFAATVLASLKPGGLIDGIACNAGLQLEGPIEMTEDGVERTFAANCLGHFVLVHALLSQLSPATAVVSIGSSAHLPGTKIAARFGFRGAIFPNADAVAGGQLDPSVSTVQQGVDRYATSKLCNILFTFEMARRVPLSKARFLVLDPGLMPGTGLARGRSSFTRFTWFYFLPTLRIFLGSVMSTPARSATALAALLTGTLYGDRTSIHVDFTLAETPTSPDAKRQDLARDLYDMSARLGGVDRLPEDVVASLAG